MASVFISDLLIIPLLALKHVWELSLEAVPLWLLHMHEVENLWKRVCCVQLKMLVCSAWLIDPLTHWCLCNLEPSVWTGLWIINSENMQSTDWSMLPLEPAWDCSFSILARARRCMRDRSQAFLQLELQFEPIIMEEDVLWKRGFDLNESKPKQKVTFEEACLQ